MGDLPGSLEGKRSYRITALNDGSGRSMGHLQRGYAIIQGKWWGHDFAPSGCENQSSNLAVSQALESPAGTPAIAAAYTPQNARAATENANSLHIANLRHNCADPGTDLEKTPCNPITLMQQLGDFSHVILGTVVPFGISDLSAVHAIQWAFTRTIRRPQVGHDLGESEWVAVKALFSRNDRRVPDGFTTSHMEVTKLLQCWDRIAELVGRDSDPILLTFLALMLFENSGR
jgi:hypothetical protein